MKIVKSKERSSRKGPAEWFTGGAWIAYIVGAAESSRLRVFRVSFEPVARTAWHTHPVGQTLHVLTGTGFVQLDGESVLKMYTGDTVMIAPNERHWHGLCRATRWCISPCRKRTRKASMWCSSNRRAIKNARRDGADIHRGAIHGLIKY